MCTQQHCASVQFDQSLLSLAIQNTPSEDSDQTVGMAGRSEYSLGEHPKICFFSDTDANIHVYSCTFHVATFLQTFSNFHGIIIMLQITVGFFIVTFLLCYLLLPFVSKKTTIFVK